MADEHVRETDPYLQGSVPNNVGRPPTLPPSAAPPGAQRSEIGAFARYMVGVVIVLVLGWGLIFMIGLLAARWHIGLPLEAAAGIGAAISLVAFLLLERDMWLTRFMGLTTWTNSPVAEAILLWLLGVPGILVRSTTPTPAPSSSLPPPDPVPGSEQVRAGRLPATAPAPAARNRPTQVEEKDTFREVVETIVFVVVLVLLLKAFVAEAFVIPTGSMATTLLGYHRAVTCPQCGHEFPVNASKEADTQELFHQDVTGCECPNCRYHIFFGRRAQEGAFP